LLFRHPPTSPLFPYTTLFRSRKFLIVHGDMINDHDYPYRFWRFASKNAVSRLGLKIVPRRTARSFVDGVEKRLARSNFKHKSTLDRKSTRLNSSHRTISYAVF